MPAPLFEIHPWKIAHHGMASDVRLMESITSIGNGYMGMRGNFEEGYSGGSHQGTYIAGVWFPDKTRVGWWKNGYPQYFGKVINAINFAKVGILVNGQAIDLAQISPDDFYVELDMQTGLLTRSYTLSLSCTKVKFDFRRFFSIVERRLALFELKMVVLEGKAEIQLISALDGDVQNEDSNYGERFWDITDKKVGNTSFIQMRTCPNPYGAPQFTVSATMKNRLSIYSTPSYTLESTYVSENFAFCLTKDDSAVLEKTVVVITDRDSAVKQHRDIATELLNKAEKSGFAEHLAAQASAWQKRWSKADVVIHGDDEAQQGIHFNLFQLFCTYYGEDERLNIGPKGFTGEKYGGATYWDTEAYILPMYLALTGPEVSEKLLRYRHAQLEGAKHNARQQGIAGALYPMVTFTGVECHNEWEITFEEIHRNGAIAYAIYNYTNYTGDEKYLLNKGIDVLVEISRFWADRVHFSKNEGMYMIHGVTGPNEYENNVNNNWYTNYLACWTLEYTLECLSRIPDRKATLLGVSRQEQEHWRDIRNNMYLPEDTQRNIFVQHDTFLDKELCPADTIPPQERPICQHWSWDRILRSCFIKQADVLQGIYLFGSRFTREQKERNFDFYEPMTVHESSLSACIHAILAAELGKEEKAMALFKRTARLDLDNYNNDTEDGLHITSMSGSWLVITQGFAGMRTDNGRLSFAPFCPREWAGYSFTILYRQRKLRVEVNQEQTHITLLSGEPLELEVCGKARTLDRKGMSVPLKGKTHDY